MPPPPSAPGSATAIGLSAGMGVGAVFLGARALLAGRYQCPPELSGEECAFELGLAHDTARLFLLFAAGLLLVGVGVFVLFRKKKEPPP